MSNNYFKINKKGLFRNVIRVVAILVAIVASLTASWGLSNNKGIYVTFTCGFFLFLSSILEFIVGDLWVERKFPRGTERALRTYRESIQDIDHSLLEQIDCLKKKLVGCSSDKVNGTVHLVKPIYSRSDSEKFEEAFVQITKYSGASSGRSWRVIDVSKGIVGRCYRTRQREIVNFKDRNEYDFRMVREFGFTKDELSSHSFNARSYLAEPLREGPKVVGVLYLFSEEPQVFPRCASGPAIEFATSEIIKLLKEAAVI